MDKRLRVRCRVTSKSKIRRTIDFVGRIREAAAYTPETGALLGIIPSSSGGPSIPTDDASPIKATAAPGNIVEVKFTRGSSDGISLEMKIDNDSAWASAGRFPRSPAVIVVPDGTELPRSVQLGARFLDGNDPVGPNSDTVTISTLP